MVAASETCGLLWASALLGSLVAIHRQPAPQWQAAAVGRTPLFVGERVQNSPLATTQCAHAPHTLLFHPWFISLPHLSLLHWHLRAARACLALFLVPTCQDSPPSENGLSYALSGT